MRIKIECTDGPRKGDQFTIKNEVIIGRKRGDLPLRDSKCSSEHAKIYFNSDGLPVIEDLDSANGTEVNGARVKSQVLNVGDLIMLGATALKVTDVEISQAAGENSGARSLYQTEQAPAQLRENSDKVQWAETLKKLMRDVASEETLKPTEAPLAFSPPLELEFKSGFFTGNKVTFGFGPRKVGRLSGDVMLPEKLAPDIAFEIIPQHNGRARYHSDFSEQVYLNNKPLRDEEVKNGDQIKIGDTTIVINFLDTL